MQSHARPASLERIAGDEPCGPRERQVRGCAVERIAHHADAVDEPVRHALRGRPHGHRDRGQTKRACHPPHTERIARRRVRRIPAPSSPCRPDGAPPAGRRRPNSTPDDRAHRSRAGEVLRERGTSASVLQFQARRTKRARVACGRRELAAATPTPLLRHTPFQPVKVPVALAHVAPPRGPPRSAGEAESAAAPAAPAPRSRASPRRSPAWSRAPARAHSARTPAIHRSCANPRPFLARVTATAGAAAPYMSGGPPALRRLRSRPCIRPSPLSTRPRAFAFARARAHRRGEELGRGRGAAGGCSRRNVRARAGLNRGLTDAALGELRRQLDYKAGARPHRAGRRAMVPVEPALLELRSEAPARPATSRRASPACTGCARCSKAHAPSCSRATWPSCRRSRWGPSRVLVAVSSLWPALHCSRDERAS